MARKMFAGIVCLALAAVLLHFGRAPTQDDRKPTSWSEIAPGIWRSARLPAAHALVSGDRAVIIDAYWDTADIAIPGVQKIDFAILTHHHRDTCQALDKFMSQGIPVRGPKAAAPFLLPAEVKKYWSDAVPLRNSRTSYLIVPEGFKGLQLDVEDGRVIEWHDWQLLPVATPGHSRDHLAYLARRGKAGKAVLFAGDALAAPGKLWTPYTTDWDHWTDAGLVPTAASLRKLARLRPAIVSPAHGPLIMNRATEALEQTAIAVEEVAFLKSFERYTKNRLGRAPEYRFLAKEQVASAGEKPWSQVSGHLFVTGNTYVLTSRDNACLVFDPWGKLSVDQITRLRSDRNLGPVELVLFSHAHYDHFDGVFDLPNRQGFQVWALDQVALPLADPALLRAPFLDPRPIRFDRRLRDGEIARWREYELKFHHLPGQTVYTMGVEVTIDGKRCFFSADNFFHQDQFSGSGGWMGLNRSFPLPYAASAEKILRIAPEWVLAEHGGPFEFNAEDFRRRAEWGRACARAADAVCVNGRHIYDWNLHRVALRPVLHQARAGATIKADLVAENPLDRPLHLDVIVTGRGVFPDQRHTLVVPAGGTAEKTVSISIPESIGTGRHVFVARVDDRTGVDGSDCFLVVDVVR